MGERVSRFSPRCVPLLIIFVLGVTSLARAQHPTGSIEGTVTDPAGAVIPRATVKITEVSTGRVITLATDEAGVYIARNLLPGAYKIEVSASGFVTGILEVTVFVGQVTRGDISLRVAGVAAEVEVVAVPEAQVDTVRHQVDGVIRAREIDQLPLNARNFLELARLEPGVIVRDGGSIDPTKVNAYRVVGVAGRGGTGTRIQIDGIDVTDEMVGSTVLNISDDAVAEFQLTRSSLDLSTSLTASGAVSIVTRSGGNEVHGSFFYFGRNQRLSAIPQPTSPRPNPPFHRHQLGYRASGPFVKDKLFWFSNWERFYQADEFEIAPGRGVAVWFPQMAGRASLPLGIRYVTERVDWNIGSAARAFYRFSHSWDESTGGTGPSPFQNVDWTNVSVVGLDITKGRVTHSYRFGYVNFNNRIESKELKPWTFPRTSQGIPYFIDFTGLGPNSLAPQATYQDNFDNKYDGSWVYGSHTIRFGGQITRFIQGVFANFAGPLQINGDFTTSPGGTRDQVIARGGNPQDPLEYPLVNFTVGPQNGFFTVAPAHNMPHGGHFNTRLAWYVGDTWRVRRNLSLNYGVRWNYDTGYFNDEVKRVKIRRPAVLSLFTPAGTRSPKMPKDRFSPTFGFAWDPVGDAKTSIRGGFYLAYEINIKNNTLFDQFALIPPGIGPDVYDITFVAGPDGTPIDIGPQPGFPQGFPGGDYTALAGRRIKDVLDILGKIYLAVQAAYAGYQFDPTRGPSLFELSRGVTFGFLIPGDFRIPYSMQFNIGVQRELAPGTVLSVDYIRNRGVGMPFLGVDMECRRCADTLDVAAARAQVNRVLGGLTVDQWIAANPGRTIAAFGLASDAIFIGRTREFTRARIMQGGFSLYQGLQARLVGRLTNKLGFVRDLNYIISYALGRSEATNGSNRVEFLNNAINKRNMNAREVFGPIGLDRTHILTAGVVLTIPGGLRFSQIWSFQTAGPVNLFVPALGAVTGANTLFTTDLNGDGTIGTTPQVDVLPGTRIGDFGRKIKSWRDLNRVIQAFNQNFAGKLTPAGQALVRAGIFTEEQLRKLGAVIQPIPLVPENNPWPFHNVFNLDLRITRPIVIEDAKFVKNLRIEPYFDAFNVFNRRSVGGYPGTLGGGFGSFNFDYAGTRRLGELRDARGYLQDPRIVQFGFRVEF
ncbi:hypothetical protein HRbin10_01670 [bacterium HR10]|nr:hypothetical protein HRbin10_01670 [bacterium HR10]